MGMKQNPATVTSVNQLQQKASEINLGWKKTDIQCVEKWPPTDFHIVDPVIQKTNQSMKFITKCFDPFHMFSFHSFSIFNCKLHSHYLSLSKILRKWLIFCNKLHSFMQDEVKLVIFFSFKTGRHYGISLIPNRLTWSNCDRLIR